MKRQFFTQSLMIFVETESLHDMSVSEIALLKSFLLTHLRSWMGHDALLSALHAGIFFENPQTQIFYDIGVSRGDVSGEYFV